MKEKIEELLQQVVILLKTEEIIPHEVAVHITVERCREAQHGDLATNLALVLAKPAGLKPRELAERIVKAFPKDSGVSHIEIAGPGFINFFINPNLQFEIVRRIHQQGPEFGLSRIGAGKKVQVEFVSANPTGPLHVGHGRGAAYGSVVADLLETAGFEVHREYYVNDAGRQMDILAASIWLRYLEACGEVVHFPSNGYRGEYIRECAWTLHKQSGETFRKSVSEVYDGIPPDEAQGGDKEIHIDALIAKAKKLLGTSAYGEVFHVGLNSILTDIQDDLKEFGVDYQQWFSEQSLMDDGLVEEALKRLQAAGYLYEKDGAIWFASSRIGDEKDRVVVRENGQYTYFASDIAYHMHKLDRGFDQIINVWGADHHGYIPRVRAAIRALGADDSRLEILLVQFATLYRGEEKVQMSTRSGEFVTLRQLRNEVGKDAARFFYLLRRSEQHMDFDLKLATSKTNDNPVFYVQYAHARICSVFRQLDEKGWDRNLNLGMNKLELLVEPHETELLATLAIYPEILERAALQHEPHQLILYLRGLANHLHTYYNAHQFLVDDDDLRNARLNLIDSVRQVLVNGLAILKITAPETM